MKSHRTLSATNSRVGDALEEITCKDKARDSNYDFSAQSGLRLPSEQVLRQQQEGQLHRLPTSCSTREARATRSELCNPGCTLRSVLLAQRAFREPAALRGMMRVGLVSLLPEGHN